MWGPILMMNILEVVGLGLCKQMFMGHEWSLRPIKASVV